MFLPLQSWSALQDVLELHPTVQAMVVTAAISKDIGSESEDRGAG